MIFTRGRCFQYETERCKRQDFYLVSESVLEDFNSLFHDSGLFFDSYTLFPGFGLFHDCCRFMVAAMIYPREGDQSDFGNM